MGKDSLIRSGLFCYVVFAASLLLAVPNILAVNSSSVGENRITLTGVSLDPAARGAIFKSLLNNHEEFFCIGEDVFGLGVLREVTATQAAITSARGEFSYSIQGGGARSVLEKLNSSARSIGATVTPASEGTFFHITYPPELTSNQLPRSALPRALLSADELLLNTLGITQETARPIPASNGNEPGIKFESVAANSFFSSLGIQPGTTITHLNGNTIGNLEELTARIRETASGVVSIRYIEYNNGQFYSVQRAFSII